MPLAEPPTLSLLFPFIHVPMDALTPHFINNSTTNRLQNGIAAKLPRFALLPLLEHVRGVAEHDFSQWALRAGHVILWLDELGDSANEHTAWWAAAWRHSLLSTPSTGVNAIIAVAYAHQHVRSPLLDRSHLILWRDLTPRHWPP